MSPHDPLPSVHDLIALVLAPSPRGFDANVLAVEFTQEYNALRMEATVRGSRAGLLAAASCALATAALHQATKDVPVPPAGQLAELDKYVEWIAEHFPEQFIYVPLLCARMILRIEDHLLAVGERQPPHH